MKEKKGLHTVLIPIDAIIPMDHGKSDLSTSPTMTERAVRRKRSWRTKRWERKAGTENDNEKTATSRPRARQRRRQGNDQENGDADATKITSNNVTIPYLRIKCTTTKQNICHRQSVGSIHSRLHINRTDWLSIDWSYPEQTKLKPNTGFCHVVQKRNFCRKNL